MTSIGVTPRAVDQVLRLDNKRYFLASQDQVDQLDGVRRAWDVRRVGRQQGDPASEFEIALATWNLGYGYSFAGAPGVYEKAAGWDLSAPGKARTWPRLATCEAVTDVDYRGWLFFDYTSGYLYMGRGRYITKYAPNDVAGDTWQVLEFHQLGANMAVSGRPANFNGRWYLPFVDTTTDTLQRFHELTTLAAPVTEVQRIVESGTPTGGTWTATFDDGVTSTTATGLAFNISAADLQTALRLIPGLQKVTVTRTGAGPADFTWDITMTAAPTAIGTASPPQFTASAAGLTGGAPVLTPSTTTAGSGDTWTRAEALLTFRTFTVWDKATVGALLVGANGSTIQTCATGPTTAANWSAAQTVHDTSYPITALAPWGRFLMCGRSDGLFSFDEQGIATNELPDLNAVVDPQNFIGMDSFNGALLCPHKLGLIRYHPGVFAAAWSLVGAEQDGAYDGERDPGWGRVMGLAPYGRQVFTTVADTYNTKGSVTSLLAPGSQQRGPLTPHMHQHFASLVEGCVIATLKSQPTVPHTPTTFSDDNAVGTITWSNPSNAGTEDGSYATAAAGTSHYLKGLNPVPVVPSGATINGIKVEIKRARATTEASFAYTGAQQDWVVPANVTSIVVDIAGAGSDGRGGRVQATIAVTPADTLHIFVGGSGYNGGAAGSGGGTAGGGATDIRQGGTALGDRVAIAGGGGGSGGSIGNPIGHGGDGGYTSGTAGTASASGAGGGTAGSSSAGGSGGAGANGGSAGSAGSSGNGGAGGAGGGPPFQGTGGGGGGGGYYGGGGGGGDGPGGGGGGGGGGSSYTTGTSPTYTSGYQSGNGYATITYGAGGVTDATVSLVKAGAVVGSNKAATTTQWPTDAAFATYGSATDLWGTTWTAAQVNAATFGVVLSATVTSAGTAQVDLIRMTIYCTVAGAGDAGSYLIAITLDATKAIATPYAYKLARAGLAAANDPNIDHAASSVSFDTSRYTTPSRNVQKTYRSVEFYVDLLPETNTPGFQLWASVEDGTFFQLRDATGAVATITTSGAYELFFPATSAAVGRWVQLEPRVPVLAGDNVGVAVDLRDVTIRGTWTPKTTELITATLVLGAGTHQDGFAERRTAIGQREDLIALDGARADGDGPIELHDPEADEDTYCVVAGPITMRRVKFKGASAATWVAQVPLRKAPYA